MALNHLKNIPCPAGEACTAFCCLFQHERDTDHHIPQILSHESGTTNGALASVTGSPPRKRLKMEGPIQSSPPSTSVQITTKSGATRLLERIESVSVRPLSSAERSVSPPPLKRKVLKSEPEEGEVIETDTPPKPATNPKALSRPLRASKTDEVETLNPRLVKNAPASHAVRVKLLTMLHSEYARLNTELSKDASEEESKLVLSDQDLIRKALDYEERSSRDKPGIYANLLKNKVMEYRRMNVIQWKEERAEEIARSGHKDRQDKGSLGPPKVIETGLPPAAEVQIVRRLLTPIQNLAQHGYVSRAPSEDEIKEAQKALDMSAGWEVCDRCRKRYQVFPGRREEDGAIAGGGSCLHHFGKTYFPERGPNDRSKPVKRYTCCGEAVGDTLGCATAENHVFKTTDPKRMATLLNFAETPPNADVPADRAVCFDCEMGYTTYGMELIRLTAISWPAGEGLLDVLVRPKGEILDLNSRYSGIWPQHMVEAQPWAGFDPPQAPPATYSNSESQNPQKKLRIAESPEVARQLLFSLLAPDTPLIGHGLENDLNAVRIIHPTLVDSILLYPHKHGLPYRYGLKKLVADFLNRSIQTETEGTVQGHDSAEDAKAAGDLVRLKVMEEWKKMKLDGWKWEEGNLVGPVKV